MRVIIEQPGADRQRSNFSAKLCHECPLSIYQAVHYLWREVITCQPSEALLDVRRLRGSVVIRLEKSHVNVPSSLVNLRLGLRDPFFVHLRARSSGPLITWRALANRAPALSYKAKIVLGKFISLSLWTGGKVPFLWSLIGAHPFPTIGVHSEERTEK